MVAAFNDTVTLGTVILGAMITFATLVGLAYGVRYRAAYEAANSRATQLHDWLNEALERERRLEQRLSEAATTIGSQRATIDELQKLPNLSAVVDAMNRQNEIHTRDAREFLERGIEKVGGMFRQHEQRALERHEGIVAALAAIAATLERANGPA